MAEEDYYNEALQLIKDKMQELGMDYDINIKTVTTTPFEVN